MTRRDFQLIAGVLEEFAEEIPAPVFARVVRRFGDELYGTNPRFDRGRFERAAGLDHVLNVVTGSEHKRATVHPRHGVGADTPA